MHNKGLSFGLYIVYFSRNSQKYHIGSCFFTRIALDGKYHVAVALICILTQFPPQIYLDHPKGLKIAY